MISNSILVQSGSGTNDFFEDCCGRAEFTIKLAPGEPNHTINKIDWLENGIADCGSAVISFNGTAWSNPLPFNFTLTQLNELKIVVDICECNGTPIQGELKLGTTAGPNHSFFYDFNPIPCSLAYLPTNLNWFPCSNDCNVIQPVSIELQNPTPLSYLVNLTEDCDVSAGGTITYYLNGVAQTSVPFYFPPSQNSVIEWIICPEFTTGFSCTINVEVCTQKKNVKLDVFPVVCTDCGLNCAKITLNTENNYLPSFYDFCSIEPGEAYIWGAIGEKKIIDALFQYNNGFFASGANIYINPVLFDVICNFSVLYGTPTIDSPPPTGWSYTFNIADIGAGPKQMSLFGAGVNANSQKNISATIEFLDNYSFNIVFEFYLIADIENWIDSTAVSNQFKLLKNHISAPIELVNNVQSVYNTDKNLCVLTYISDPNNLVPIIGTNPVQYKNFECDAIKSTPFTARFYNKGLYNTAPEMSNPVFTLERNTIQVNNFSTLLKTDVTFQIQYPGNITNIIFWVIDASQADNTLTFLDNYDSSRGEITTNPLVSVIDNNLYSPSTGPTLVSPGVWECSAKVGTSLNPNGEYRIIAVCYNSGAYIVNSFISDPIFVTEVPGVEICCFLDIISNWADYKNTFPGNCFAPTMKERIYNSLKVSVGPFSTCLQQFGWNPALVDWVEFLTDIKLNIYRKQNNFPNVGQSTYFMFNQYQSIRQTGFPNNFNNLSSDFTCAENTPGLYFDVQWNGRVRYETIPVNGTSVFVSNNSTPMQRITAGALGSTYVSTLGVNYDWADKDIYFEYIFRFDLSSLFAQPFVANLVYINKIHPIDFETTPNPYSSLFKPLVVAGVKGTNPPEVLTGSFCQGQYDYLIVTMQDNVSPDLVGHFIAFLDPFPYGVNNLQEEESVASSTGMTQLSSAPIYNVSPTFNGSAQFFVDLSTLPVGKYQLCGLYLKQ